MDQSTAMTGGSDTRQPRLLTAPELTFELEAELEQLRNEPGYADFGRSSKTLARSGPLRVVLTAAREGVELGAFEADGPVAVQVLRGRLSDGASDGLAFGTGSLIWFGGGGSWAVRVDEDAVLLLAVAGNDDGGPAR